MHSLPVGFRGGVLLLALLCTIVGAAHVSAQDYKWFTSEEYGFVMKYPANWVKAEPQGSYYMVFQSPELTGAFRSRIQVVAHKPVKDPINVFVQETKNGITELQKKPNSPQKAKIIDEGPFKSDVPGAYYLFLEAVDNKNQIDVIIVFYKHDQTLLRISCLAPSKTMEDYHALFNDVLTSVKFAEAPPQAQRQQPSRTQPAQQPQPAPDSYGAQGRQEQPQPDRRYAPPADPGRQAPAPPPQGYAPQGRPAQPAQPLEEPEEEEVQEQAPAPTPPPAPARPAPRGPTRAPAERPGGGIVN